MEIKRWSMRCFAGMTALWGSACGPINVMGRSTPDSEYIVLYDADMAREKQGLPPIGGHDEDGRPWSWDKSWCSIGPTRTVPPTAQSRRMRRYIVEKRRKLGLVELSCAGEKL
jgi:hypothetical protein